MLAEEKSNLDKTKAALEQDEKELAEDQKVFASKEAEIDHLRMTIKELSSTVAQVYKFVGRASASSGVVVRGNVVVGGRRWISLARGRVEGFVLRLRGLWFVCARTCMVCVCAHVYGSIPGLP